MIQPDTLHNILALLIAGLLLGFGWCIGTWACSLLPLWGRVVAFVVLVVAAVLMMVGRL